MAVDCIVSVKSLDLARKFYYKENFTGYSRYKFQEYLKNEHGIIGIEPIIEEDIWIAAYKIKFVDDSYAAFYVLKFD